jgi:hypothetical protein
LSGGCSSSDVGSDPDESADLRILTSELPAGHVGQPYRADLAVGGTAGTDVEWEVRAGTLPDGLALERRTSAVARIVGIPSSEGESGLTIAVSDANGRTASARLTLRVYDALRVRLVLAGVAEVGTELDARVQVEGGSGAGYAWTIDDASLPPGITIGEVDDATRRLLGAPTTEGTFSFDVEVTDSAGGRVDDRILLRVLDEPRGVSPEENYAYDLLNTDLDIDLATQTATAVLTLDPLGGTSASFDIDELEVFDVWDAGGRLRFVAGEERLDVAILDGTTETEVGIRYRYRVRGETSFGVSPSRLWSYVDHCDRAFPCKQVGRDGTSFTVRIRGVPSGATAIYPTEMPNEVPSYAFTWAVGAYQVRDLGTTPAGTTVRVVFEPDQEQATLFDTQSLVDHVAWFEALLGPSALGDQLTTGFFSSESPFSRVTGTVGFPVFFVSAGRSPSFIPHGVAHGWFGTGIGMACTEDMVLLEGVVTYLTARVRGAVDGLEAEEEEWARIEQSGRTNAHRVAWPIGNNFGERRCNDAAPEDVFGVSHDKGALFLRALEATIGTETMDLALRTFYERFVGRSVLFDDLLGVVEEVSGYAPYACANSWLRATTLPEVEDRCP